MEQKWRIAALMVWLDFLLKILRDLFVQTIYGSLVSWARAGCRLNDCYATFGDITHRYDVLVGKGWNHISHVRVEYMYWCYEMHSDKLSKDVFTIPNQKILDGKYLLPQLSVFCADIYDYSKFPTVEVRVL